MMEEKDVEGGSVADFVGTLKRARTLDVKHSLFVQ